MSCTLCPPGTCPFAWFNGTATPIDSAATLPTPRQAEVDGQATPYSCVVPATGPATIGLTELAATAAAGGAPTAIAPKAVTTASSVTPNARLRIGPPPRIRRPLNPRGTHARLAGGHSRG